MANKWIAFLQDYRKKNPTLSLKQAMRQGAALYRKSKSAPAKAPKKKAGKKKRKN